MPRKVLKNTSKTKKYLDKLPKVYAVFHWAKWGILEVHWSWKYKEGMPLVYTYYDGNGCCDEWHLMPIDRVSSGSFWNFYSTREAAEQMINRLNEDPNYDKF